LDLRLRLAYPAVDLGWQHRSMGERMSAFVELYGPMSLAEIFCAAFGITWLLASIIIFFPCLVWSAVGHLMRDLLAVSQGKEQSAPNRFLKRNPPPVRSGNPPKDDSVTDISPEEGRRIFTDSLFAFTYFHTLRCPEHNQPIAKQWSDGTLQFRCNCRHLLTTENLK